MNLQLLVRIAMVTLPLVAWAATVRHRPHGWFAAFASWIVAGDALAPLDLWLPIDRSLKLSISFFFVALTTHYFLQRSARLVLAALGVAVLWLFAHPTMPTSTFQRAYFSTYDAATAIVWAMIVYTALFRRGLRPNLAHLAIVLFAATDAVTIIFPALHWNVIEWRVVMVTQLVGVVTSIVAHLVFLARTRREPATIAPS